VAIHTLEKEICRRIQAREDELIRLLSELIAINTADPPGENYDQCAQFLKSQLSDIGADVEIIQPYSEVLVQYGLAKKPVNRPSVIATVNGLKRKPVLHFNGHYDVVPASGSWRVDPYAATVQNGKIYGRGATDMKAGIAAMIMAAKVLRQENIQLDGTLSLSFVPDEERDGPAGTRFLIESGMISADYCIVGEPTGGVDLCYGHKGSLWLEITTYGRSTHGSRPWKGINAFTQMVEVVKEIDRNIKPSLLYQEGVDISDQVAGMTGTISLGGIISSGNSLNVVPASCMMTVDRRLAPGESPAQVLDNFHSILRGLEKKSSDFKADVRILSQYPAYVTSVDTLIISTLEDTLLDITGVKPELFLMLGGCDMRFFHSRGIQTVIYGPGIRGMSHQSDEYVELDKIVTATQVYAITALRLLGVK